LPISHPNIAILAFSRSGPKQLDQKPIFIVDFSQAPRVSMRILKYEIPISAEL